MPLTDAAVRNAKPGITPAGKPTARPYKMGDAGWLYLEVAPDGGKWWRLKYRFDSKEKRLALGVMNKRAEQTFRICDSLS
ncbi:MAG: Arm DNA-binding domain-containing protein [Porticoccaceae bacterium]